jgi:drug/metabolite transporter (DMT)-like permease
VLLKSAAKASGQAQNSAYMALIAVCVLWGTTYLGIRVAVETIPPFYLIAGRYTVSGAALLIGARIAGLRIPSGRELIGTSICGAICIGIGNGFLALAETWIPSGLAALFYTTCPFWMVGIDALLPGGKRPLASTIRGLLVGVAGVVILVLPAAIREGFRGGTFTGFLVLQLSAAGWVFGALLQKRVETRSEAIVTGAVQQLAAGLAMFLPAALFEHIPHNVSSRSAFAVAYLVLFGSGIGFTAFIYAITRLPVAIVSVYTFVNPVVALFLGWLFFREAFGVRELIAMFVIFAGIVVVKWSESRGGRGVLKQATAADLEAVGPEP